MSAKPRVVVIGGGTAGCMVVSHLANNSDASITLIEPGALSSHDDDPRFFNVLDDHKLVTSHSGFPQAISLGGGSAVNAMVLTGDEPAFARGLTRMANSDDVGLLGHFLLGHGGRFARLWWNGARWNPGRAVRHLQEEGRISILQDSATEVLATGGVVHGVRTTRDEIDADYVVLCAGAIHTPRILVASGLMAATDVDIRNHFSLNFLVKLANPSQARFDTAVVKEWVSASGNAFLIHAYERASATDDAHGLISIVHMNPKQGSADSSAMEEGFQELSLLADSLSQAQGVLGVTRSREFSPVSHPCCSCTSVLNEQGDVRGVRGVFVADASALVTIPQCTPAAPVTMEALRVAHVIAKEIS